MGGEQQQPEGQESTQGQEVSRRRAIGYGGALAAGAVAVGLLQTQTAAADDSRGGPGTLRSVTLDEANRIAAAGVEYARSHSLPPMYILVVDVSGDEKASLRMDGNGPASVTLVPIKARTSIGFRAATADLAARTTDPARIASLTAAGFSLLGGGRPIVENGAVIGAVAVGGGSPEQDDEVARAAIAAL